MVVDLSVAVIEAAAVVVVKTVDDPVLALGLVTPCTARCLDEIVAITRLVVNNGDSAACIGTKRILSRRIRRSTRNTRSGLDYPDVQGLSVRLTHQLI